MSRNTVSVGDIIVKYQLIVLSWAVADGYEVVIDESEKNVESDCISEIRERKEEIRKLYPNRKFYIMEKKIKVLEAL